MLTSALMFTALPNGLEGRLANVSVVVSFRLQDSEGLTRGLRDYVDETGLALLEWPPPELSIGFELDGVPVTATSVSRGDPQLWTALFSDAKVIPWRFDDWSASLIRSYPAAHFHDVLSSGYTTIASEFSDEPPDETQWSSGRHASLNDFNAALARTPDRGRDERRRRADAAAKDAAEDLRGDPEMDVKLDMFEFFHDRDETAVEAQVTDFDFHQAVTAVMGTPDVARLLGVVLDFQIRLPIPRFGEPAELPGLRAVVSGLPSSVFAYTPLTRCVRGRGTFRTAGRDDVEQMGAELFAGFLDLAPPKVNASVPGGYRLSPVDIDLGVLNAIQFSEAINGQFSSSPAAPAALSSGGIALIHDRRAALLKSGNASQLLRARTLNESFVTAEAEYRASGETAYEPVELLAEDVMSGIRVDVLDETVGSRQSLCSRKVRAEFLAVDDETHRRHEFDDEGVVTLGGTATADDASTDLWLSEVVTRWNGWSIVAPRPGDAVQALEVDADGHGHSPHGTASNEPLDDFPLVIEGRAASGSLPRLRYGRSYRLLARGVDLAGNGPGPADAPPDNVESEAMTYGRFEPVPSPFLVQVRPDTPGESIERLVLRSGADVDPDGGPRRHVLPPRTAWNQAEAHGLFDDSARLRRTAYDLYTPREGAVLDQRPYGDDENIPAYLPDPLARSACFVGLPGMPEGDAQLVSFGTGIQHPPSWPEAQPFRLLLADGTGAPELDYDARTLTVFLPPSGRARVKLSCALVTPTSPSSEAQLTTLGLFNWLKEHGLASAELIGKIFGGRHWMFTPPRELDLIHAVRTPLAPPDVAPNHPPQALPERQAGQTTQAFTGKLTVHAPSTGRVSLNLYWQEWFDDPRKPAPVDETRTVVVGERTVRENEAIVSVAGMTQEFGDTKHRLVHVSATASSRFLEYFRERLTGQTLTGDPLQLAAGKLVLAANVEVTDASSPQRRFELGTHYVVDPWPGTIALASKSNEMANRKVDISFVSGETWQTTELEHAQEPAEALHVKSSARPAPPAVRYVVPTFGWSATADEHTRGGGGLRIYLDRPWFSSGIDEQLAVIVYEGSKDAVGEVLEPFTSTWAQDPLRSTAALASDLIPPISAFTSPNSTKIVKGLSIPEFDPKGANFAALPINVTAPESFDADKKLWFADIVVDVGPTYFPFVRLALARYQANSVPGCALSPITAAEFVQVAPDRTAAIVVDIPTRSVRITVSGPSYFLADDATSSTMIATLERRAPGAFADPEFGWEPVPEIATQLGSERIPKTEFGLMWTGELPLGTTRGELRLVLEEFELYPQDADAGPPRRRVVYLDTFPVDVSSSPPGPRPPRPRPPRPF